MPYKKLSDLPEPIKEHLPKEAQKIYRATFNAAWDEYADPKSRRDDSSREEIAHKVAWSSVKKKYKKGSGDHWVEK